MILFILHRIGQFIRQVQVHLYLTNRHSTTVDYTPLLLSSKYVSISYTYLIIIISYTHLLLI